MGTMRHRIVLIGAAGFFLTSVAGTQAELWRCKQANGAVLFSDRGGAGCRKLDEAKDLPQLEQLPSSPAPANNRGAETLRFQSTEAPTPVSKRSSTAPFAAASRTVISLAVANHVSDLDKARGKPYKPEVGDY